MATKADLQDKFYSFVGSAVSYYKDKRGLTNSQLAIRLNLSESFVKQANIGIKHYNSFHLWKIAKVLDVPVAKLYPPTDKDHFSEYLEIKPMSSKQNYLDLIQELEDKC